MGKKGQTAKAGQNVEIVSGLTGEIALRLSEEARTSPLLHLTTGERRADELARAVGGFAPDLEVLVFPAWDCLPYDRAPPSREIMGRRVAALCRLAEGRSAPLVIATPGSALQRVPPRETWARATTELRIGQPLVVESLQSELERLGYVVDERVDEVGEAALRGRAIDIFPAATPLPVRIEHRDGAISAIHSYDPATQLTTSDLERVRIRPASEVVSAPGEEPLQRFPGMEHWLPECYGALQTIFDYLPGARLILDGRAQERLEAAFAQIADAYESRTRLRPERAAGQRPPHPSQMYLDRKEWEERLASGSVTTLEARPAEASARPVPSFAGESRPFRKLAALVEEQQQEGRRVILAAPHATDLARMEEGLGRCLDLPVRRMSAWRCAAGEKAGVLSLVLDLEDGFIDPHRRLAIVTASEMFGSRAQAARAQVAQPLALAGTEIEFRLGDAVIHMDHGVGVLRGIERVEAEGSAGDLIRLEYAGEATLMVPAAETGKLWRYGAAADAVSLDRLEGEAWEKRRAAVEREIRDTAERLAAVIRARQGTTAERLVPPSRAYERFVAGFPYAETPDQLAAVEDCLKDLASGRPMNRLVCGDVGFGKTEVALRAAAAVALAGKQVAVVAPTTVLVRQHMATFERRFAGLGLKLGHLSRLVTPAEAREVKKGLTNGEIRIVLGTHAIAGKGIRFKDLGLVVIDEEQRFGAAHKAQLRALSEGVHVLTLTATPIPRTLQAAMVALQDISVIATPPALRQPIRTFVMPFDEATVREALVRESRRGGQSFVVCPRIEDIAPMATRLRALVPDLDLFVAHGQMPPEEIDDAMVRFGDGEGDVLLATNIIESGLDVPRANTMLVWRADRFGLAQLHQLRGRVGRGRVRGIAYLMTDPAKKIAKATRKRLETLESLDRLGAGFAISARDLDQRGAGDLLGEEQAGHMKLIGVGLYQHLMRRALEAARGEALDEEWSPDLNIGAPGSIPETYVPEPEVRINLYARAAAVASEEDVEAFAAEMDDRFGRPPGDARRLLWHLRLKALSRAAEVARVDAGPQAIALTFRRDRSADAAVARLIERAKGALEWRGERLVWPKQQEDEEQRLNDVSRLLRRLS
jgi:transcription-repair coupling factor (superfamily II helicase)